MSGFLEGISNFFARHRAHCVMHTVYQNDCASCVAANERSSYDPGTVEVVRTGGDTFASPYVSNADYLNDSVLPSTDSSSTDVSSTDCSSAGTSDFSGFGGGDSGGGGASGDF